MKKETNNMANQITVETAKTILLAGLPPRKNIANGLVVKEARLPDGSVLRATMREEIDQTRTLEM